MFDHYENQAKDCFGDDVPNYEQKNRKRKKINNKGNTPETIFNG